MGRNRRSNSRNNHLPDSKVTRIEIEPTKGRAKALPTSKKIIAQSSLKKAMDKAIIIAIIAAAIAAIIADRVWKRKNEK